MPETAVRRAREDDLGAIREMVNWAIVHTHYNFNAEAQGLEHWRDEWRAATPRYPWLVAEGGAGVTGMAIASRYKGRCAYDWTAEVTVYVSALHHRTGVATALYRELLPMLEAQGLHSLIAVIALPNQPSIALHERFGFAAAGVTPQVGWKFGRWWDVGLWQLLLRGAEHAAEPLLAPDAVLTAAERKEPR